MFNRRKFFKIGSSALGLISMSSFSFTETKNYGNLLSIADPIKNLRSQLLVPPSRIYLNTGSLGPSPQSVIDVVLSSMKKLESNPAPENWGALGNEMETVRSKIGGFINAPAEDIILTRNTTEGLSLIGQTLKLNQGDEIITTTREHGGGEVGFEYMAQRDGATLRRVELPMPAKSVAEIVETIESALTENTRVLLLSHVNTITGMKMPIEKISSLIKARNIWLIIDGAQAPGLIDVDIENLGVDAYASSGHKWMLGPKETGFLYLSKNLQEKFKPVFTSKGFKSYSASSGTRNIAQFIGLGKSVDIHNEIGTKTIEKHCVDIADYCREKLSHIEGTSIISPTHKDLRTGIVSLKLEKANNAEISGLLAEKDIIVKTLPGINALRFSCHLFVSKEEIDRLAAELDTLLA
jgi:selenocysteine lyase/cysteine desulfurase